MAGIWWALGLLAFVGLVVVNVLMYRAHERDRAQMDPLERAELDIDTQTW